MSLQERVQIYERIEAARGRPLIAYATSTRPGAEMLMAGDAVRELIDQVRAIGAQANEVDVLIHSHGGDALTAWRMMSVLRERFNKVNVLVPFAAFSAATIFALGADQIVMHPFASLGPIDPQIRVSGPDGKGRQFAYEDLTAFLDFLKREVGVGEQVHLTTIADRLFQAIDPLVVGAAQRASELATEVGARMLGLHTDDDRACQQIAQNLNKTFFAHGDAVSRTRAVELELKVADTDEPLNALLWDAYEVLEKDLEMREPFEPLALLLADQAVATALAPRASPQIPLDAPPQVAQQIWQLVANAAMVAASAPAPQVPFTIHAGIVESRRFASEFVQSGTLAAGRLPDGNIRVISTVQRSGWHRRPVEQVQPASNPPAEAPPGLGPDVPIDAGGVQ